MSRQVVALSMFITTSVSVGVVPGRRVISCAELHIRCSDGAPGRNRYRLTSDGLRFAIFYTKVHDRLLRPLLATNQSPAPSPKRKALHTIDIHIEEPPDYRNVSSRA